jgi:hypothetical protein
MIFFAKKLANLAQTILVIRTLVIEKNAIFSAENRQKSQKIAIITSTPGLRWWRCSKISGLASDLYNFHRFKIPARMYFNPSLKGFCF